MGEAIRDDILAALADALHDQPDRIQGFLYGKDHVIRDVWLPYEQQELWRAPASGEDADEAFSRQIRIERMRLAVAEVAKQFGGHPRLAETLALSSDPLGVQRTGRT